MKSFKFQSPVRLGPQFSRRALSFLGRPIPGKLKLAFFVYSAAVFTCSFQMIIFLIVEWNTFVLRFKAFENLNVSVLCFFMLIDFGLYPEKIQVLMNIIDDSIYIYKMPLSDEMKKIKLLACKKDLSVQNQFTNLITFYYLAVFMIPVIFSVITVLFNDTVKVEELPLILVYWLPIPFDNVVIYFVQLFLQNLYGLLLCVGYTGWFVLFMSTLVHIQHEIQVLCQYLREMDERLLSATCTGRKLLLTNNLEQPVEDIEQDTRLKFYLKEIYEHHSAIISSIKKVNESSSSMMYMYNQMVCFELCINMFLYFRSEGVERYQSLVTSLVVLLLISIIGIFGQRLINESDELIRVFSECSWINKPKWFKKSLWLMTMVATHKPLQIKPVGLFVINLQNASRIVQGAYSYFNVMRTVKDK